jgi:signal transduction histidine kinase
MDILIIIIQLSIMILGYKRQKKKYEEIIKYIDAEKNMPPKDICEEDFYLKNLLRILESQKKKYDDRDEYYKRAINSVQEDITQWVHDIKVNIAICDLLLECMETEKENTHKLSYQLEQIKFRVNQVLYVTRANHYNQDFVAEEFDISTVIKSAIKDNALFFINKNIRLNTQISEINFVSDKKWFHYIISQILNNSSKYTHNNGEVNIFTKEDECAYYVHIRDNGVGIAKEDINRIFDKGFVGINGRISTKSTGMGLYYVKKIAENLKISIKVKSEKSKYTEFILILYKLSDYYNTGKI